MGPTKKRGAQIWAWFSLSLSLSAGTFERGFCVETIFNFQDDFMREEGKEKKRKEEKEKKNSKLAPQKKKVSTNSPECLDSFSHLIRQSPRGLADAFQVEKYFMGD